MGGVTDQSVANAVDKPFLMPVEEVFSLHQGRLVMVTGRIERETTPSGQVRNSASGKERRLRGGIRKF